MLEKRLSPKDNGELNFPEGRNKDLMRETFEALQEDTEIYEPWKNRNLAHPLGTGGALFHLTKASIGTGILAMPEAFSNGGLWVSLGLALVVAAVYMHCVHILVYSSQVLCRRLRRPQLSYTEIAEAAFQTGPTVWRRYTRAASNVVDAGLFFNYYACLGVYLLFVASTIKQVVAEDVAFTMDLRLYIVALTVVLVPLGMVRNLRYLVPCSLLALCAVSVCCGVVLYDVLHGLPPLSSRPAAAPLNTLPLCFSTLVFAIDGMGTVLPIENSMKRPEDFLGCFGILSVSMVWTMVLYCTMGFFGYLRYGDATQASITLNLSSSGLSQAVKLLVAINVLVSYFLYLFVPVEIICRKLYPTAEGTRKLFYDYLSRLILILASVVAAVVVPNLGLFVGLVGAVGASSTMFCFPAVIHLVTCWEDAGCCRWERYKDIILILVWLLTLVTGTHLSVVNIIQLYTRPKSM